MPASPARSASATSSCASTVSVWATSVRAASVSRTLRPSRSSNATPTSRSSVASCCEIAGGVKERASAVAAIVPRAASLVRHAGV